MKDKGLNFPIFALLFGLAGRAHGQNIESADNAMARYRTMTSVEPVHCTADPSPDTITVCSNKLRESQKVPYINELRAGDRPLRAFGEPPGQDLGAPCGPRGEGCYSGPGLKKSLQSLIDRIRD